MNNSRALAAKILFQVVEEKQSLTKVFAKFSHTFPVKDEAFIKELVFGVCRYYFRLIAIVQQLIDKPIRKKEAVVNVLLLIGLYQLIYSRVPAYAAISETVAAAKALKKPWACRLLNAVLRNFLRNKQTIDKQISNTTEVQYAHPNWFIAAIKKAWPQYWQAILIANNQHPPMILRINNSKTTKKEYLNLLKRKEIAYEEHAFADTAITIKTPIPVDELPKFSQGFCSVQDAACQLLLSCLDLQVGQRILDACAAPGGKTALMLENETQLQEIVAVDIDTERAEKIQVNLKRLCLTAATVIVGDASQPTNWWDGKLYDRILVDAPCSATGVIRRHSDIKLLRQANDIQTLASQQLALLRQLWPLLAAGGRLVYATCSILPQENDQVIQHFLEETSNAKEESLSVTWGVARPYGRQILPGMHDMDGFYYAVLVKIALDQRE